MDRIQTLRGSRIQHGPHSDRIYLMKLDEADLPGILDDLDDMAAAQGYSKIFTKIPARRLADFERRGYEAEARVPDFFADGETGVFASRFLSDARRVSDDADTLAEVLALSREKQGDGPGDDLTPPPGLSPAGPEDAAEMSRLYAEVFATYPFPIHDPDYLRLTMREAVAYYCIRLDGEIKALASAEMDPGAGNVEMTDFATRPEARGRGYAVSLLRRMESDMARRGLRTAYTIARAGSAGMNITFAKLGYAFAGTLVNNTNIGGRIESMNVWYKQIEYTDDTQEETEGI